MAPPPPPLDPRSPEAKLRARVKRYYRKVRSPYLAIAKKKKKPYKRDPKKKTYPYGKYFWKKWSVPKNHIELYERKHKRGTRKIRGARKKEAARLYKLKFPKGKPMACKPGPDYPGIMTPKVIVRFMGFGDRYARRYLTQIKKKLGKEKGHVLTVDEFCEHKGIPKQTIIPYLK
jgi:hypothetical protein